MEVVNVKWKSEEFIKPTPSSPLSIPH